MISNRDRAFLWDYFVDYCAENGLDHETEDFHAWADNKVDAAIDEAMGW